MEWWHYIITFLFVLSGAKTEINSGTKSTQIIFTDKICYPFCFHVIIPMKRKKCAWNCINWCFHLTDEFRHTQVSIIRGKWEAMVMFSKIVTSCPSFGLYGITESQNRSNMVQNMVKKLKKFRLLASPVFFVIIILNNMRSWKTESISNFSYPTMLI